ncbi:MAG: trehalose-phosphatase [bacterium]|nr:trehalose-phosphatase [bacterium]
MGEKDGMRMTSPRVNAIGGRGLWVFDFDGTLSTIVPDRDAARLHPECRQLLKELVRTPDQFVAILSSREIEDLSQRVPLPGVFLGGASGLEWRMPGGHRIHPGDVAETRREKARAVLAPLLSRLSAFPGVLVEDKGWSIAVHHRRVLPEMIAMLGPLLKELEETPGFRVFRGPFVAEAQLLPHVSKSFGVRRLCRFLGVDPSHSQILYAGDDENDAVAMRWVLRKGGIAFCVGKPMRIPGVRFVGTPVDLARAVRELAAIGPRSNRGKKGR